MATSTDGVCSRNASCSQYTQATITTGATGSQCCLRFRDDASSQTEQEYPAARHLSLAHPVTRGRTGYRPPGASHLLRLPQTKGTCKTGESSGDFYGVDYCPSAESESDSSDVSPSDEKLLTSSDLDVDEGARSQKRARRDDANWIEVLENCNAQECSLAKFPASGGGADITAEAGPHTCSCKPHSGNPGNFFSDSNGIQFGGKIYSCLFCQQHNQETTELKVRASKMTFICTVCENIFPSSRDRHLPSDHVAPSVRLSSGRCIFTSSVIKSNQSGVPGTALELQSRPAASL
ncbi:uncharacterized protein LOC144158506 isoform X3 [Haemaphysalis longicornis]